MKTIEITVNKTPIQVREDQTILEVVQEHGLDRIPTLCHSPELKPYASCFVCVVEVEGRPNLVPSCATRVAPGMEIQTRSERVVRSRRTALELLLSNHYADCVSPCALGCPAEVDVQGYLALAEMGEYRKAVDLVREANPLPGVCGRVCVRKCEALCRRTDLDEAVGINNIKRYISDSPGAYDQVPEREPDRGQSIGIVGSGPAGLTAAWFLALKGYDPIIYEALPAAGGMLRYGIPEYRLPNADLDREIKFIERAGVKIECGVRIGRDRTLDALLDGHDAVFLAPGAMAGKGMRVEGEDDTPGVVKGVDFLLEKTDNPATVSGTVVVIGGGNTAVDVARTAWRLGADKVIVLYRRTKTEMPADPEEIEDLLDEGIELMELVAPTGIVTRDDGSLKALSCIRMKLGEPDSSGRRRPVPMEGSDFDLPCDLAVPSIGQQPLIEEMLAGSTTRPGVSRWSTIDVDTETMQTSVEGLFAGGDAADDGPTVAIDAIRDGRRAALAIHSYLSGDERPAKRFVVTKAHWAKPGQLELGDVDQSPRHLMHHLPVENRVGSFEEVASGYHHEDLVHECARCLGCGCMAFNDCTLRDYAEEYGVDMDRYKGYVRKHKLDDRHPRIIYDPNKCILCARCIRTCERVLPISALGLVNRGFSTEMRPAMNDPLLETSCIACGNCIDACPSGALIPKLPFKGRAALHSEHLDSHCAFCSVGCDITINQVSNDKLYVAGGRTPGDALCHDGRFGPEIFVSSTRLLEPQQREGLEHSALSFGEAVKKAAAGLKQAATKHGPESVGVFLYPDQTNEVMYLAGRIARDGLGTNNVGSIALLETGERSGALDDCFGFSASTADRSSIREADLIICDNVDPQADFLILGMEIIAAVRRGAKLVVTGSVKNTLAEIAELELDPMRGTSGTLFAGLIAHLMRSGFFAPEMIQEMAGGTDVMSNCQARNLPATAQITGVHESKIEQAAELIKTASRVVIVHSTDRSRDLSPCGSQVLANLTLLLRGRGCHADYLLPSLASNGASVGFTGADPAFSAGRVPVNGVVGAKSREELYEKLNNGAIRAALIIGEDPIAYDRTAAYFNEVEFMAAVDWAATETTLFADVAIPGGTYLEEAGTRCNFEGRAQRYTSMLAPRGGQQTWQVLAALARELDVQLPEQIPAITDELVALTRNNLGELMGYFWNDGERPVWDGKGRLTVANVEAKPSPRTPALSVVARRRREVREVGIRDFLSNRRPRR